MIGDTSSDEIKFIPNAPAYALCMICDTKHPSDTDTCPKCHSPLSVVRKCPDCGKVVSSKHQGCIYCGASFLLVNHPEMKDLPVAAPPKRSGDDAEQRRRAILVSVGVFLIVVLAGLATIMMRSRSSVPEFAASTYVTHPSPLRLQANETAGTASTVPTGTVLRLTRMAVDPEGHRWFAVQKDGSEEFVAVGDVAPPKAHQSEAGAQMLRAWLVSFNNPDMASEAVNAVAYFCAQFPNSPRCEELRWVLAERLRHLAQRTDDPELLSRSRELYQAVANKKGPMADQAGKALESLAQEEAPRRSSGSVKHGRDPAGRPLGSGTAGQYALVDRAEVHVRVPNLKSVSKGSTLWAPVAREIRLNGHVAVPGNATCLLLVTDTDSNGSHVALQLTGIEFDGKHYDVSTAPQRITVPGAVVVFQLDSSLLIGH